MNCDHEARFIRLLEMDRTYLKDVERKALFYILSGNADLFKKVEHIYDFNDHSINTHCLGYTQEEIEENQEVGEVWMERCAICKLPLDVNEDYKCSYCSNSPDFCSSSRKLIILGFGLYNGYSADVLDTFSALDDDNFLLAIEAIKIRFGKGGFFLESSERHINRKMENSI